MGTIDICRIAFTRKEDRTFGARQDNIEHLLFWIEPARDLRRHHTYPPAELGHRDLAEGPDHSPMLSGLDGPVDI